MLKWLSIVLLVFWAALALFIYVSLTLKQKEIARRAKAKGGLSEADTQAVENLRVQKAKFVGTCGLMAGAMLFLLLGQILR